MALGIDLKPLERGMDALVRMADALERLADVAESVDVDSVVKKVTAA
jgi:hypothetical protein